MAKPVFLQAAIAMLSAVVWAGAYSGGTGTQADPYRLSTADDWLELTNAPQDWDKAFVLTNDIDLSGTTPQTVGNNTIRFNGIFDGQFHTLNNLTIFMPEQKFVGTFGYIGARGQIQRLGVGGADVQGFEAVGGLVGRNHGQITDCYVTGSVSGKEWDTGGLIGSNIGGAVSGCFAEATVVSTGQYAGGLVGYNMGDVVTDCFARGTVSGFNFVGGLVGANDNGQLVHCYSAAAVEAASSDGDIGGLAGINWYGMVIGCFWDSQKAGDMFNAIGEGKTTAEMQTVDLYREAGWNFQTIWSLCEKAEYPRLRWQNPVGDFLCPYGVQLEDFAHLAQWWQVEECGIHRCAATDLNNDGRVNTQDLLIFAAHWLERKD
ncbi:MAG: hypothetical protein GX298_10085 [Planctomycetes bacterium]|nr:hypothetical protein [Planctomycetota bacterium]